MKTSGVFPLFCFLFQAGNPTATSTQAGGLRAGFHGIDRRDKTNRRRCGTPLSTVREVRREWWMYSINYYDAGSGKCTRTTRMKEEEKTKRETAQLFQRGCRVREGEREQRSGSQGDALLDHHGNRRLRSCLPALGLRKYKKKEQVRAKMADLNTLPSTPKKTPGGATHATKLSYRPWTTKACTGVSTRARAVVSTMS